MIGETIGHYRLLDRLGQGGMGEVYRAQDTTLGREVAIKVLPAELALSQERVERFEREARVLAALDHPNIVAIHSIENEGGIHFLTMQLVTGRTLSELIPDGGMPLERIFETAIPIADALSAAHEKGIVHRDLKPANVMVSEDGRVRVLDFGLAKLRPELDSVVATELPTEPLTAEGRILGTFPYMSPEQIEGKPLDTRSDLFALGVMLYEMSTGTRPFSGDSPASTMSSILRDAPASVLDLRKNLPRDLVKIIRRCLVKTPERRFQTARELAIELRELQEEVASGEAWGVESPTPAPRQSDSRAGWIAAAVVLIVALGVVFWTRHDRRDVIETRRAGEVTFSKLVVDRAQKGAVSASPDGRFFVWASDAAGNWDIYLRSVTGGRAINLTEESAEDDRQPAFSPDGQTIAFRSERDSGGIFVMSATGGSVRRLTAEGYFPCWSPDGRKIAYSTSQLGTPWGGDADHRAWVVDLETGKEQLLVGSSALNPAWSPDGRWIAFRSEDGEGQHDLFVVPVEGGGPTRLTDDMEREWSPAWAADGGSLFYVSDRGGGRDVWQIELDEATGLPLADAQRVTSGSNVMQISPLGDGIRMLYNHTAAWREIFRVPFDPVAERTTGPQVSLTAPSIQAGAPSVSLEGDWIAFHAEFGQLGSWAIGVVHKGGTDLRQVTASGSRDLYPDWSPDSTRLAFFSNRSGSPFQAWIANRDGSDLWLLTDIPGVRVYKPRWSPDGSRITLCHVDAYRGEPAYLSGTAHPWSEEPPVRLPPMEAVEAGFCPESWSPDGASLAGVALRDTEGETRRSLAVYHFGDGTYDVLLETDLLGHADLNPHWLADGRRLLFHRDSGVFSLFDTATGEYRDVLAVDSLGLEPGGHSDQGVISPDNQDIYFDWNYEESSIAMLTWQSEN